MLDDLMVDDVERIGRKPKIARQSSIVDHVFSLADRPVPDCPGQL
jgi:hypothetical protein